MINKAYNILLYLPSECSREPGYYDLSRTKSFRIEPKNHRIFRASDLTQGELLGKGFFGQVRPVTLDIFPNRVHCICT